MPAKEPSLSLQETKDVVASKPFPRVTEESIKEKIDFVRYLQDDIHTIALIQMCNGFVFVGHSAPADPRNYDFEVGKRYAYENAFRQIWSHEGYILRDKLYDISEAGVLPSPKSVPTQ